MPNILDASLQNHAEHADQTVLRESVLYLCLGDSVVELWPLCADFCNGMVVETQHVARLQKTREQTLDDGDAKMSGEDLRMKPFLSVPNSNYTDTSAILGPLRSPQDKCILTTKTRRR